MFFSKGGAGGYIQGKVQLEFSANQTGKDQYNDSAMGWITLWWYVQCFSVFTAVPRPNLGDKTSSEWVPANLSPETEKPGHKCDHFLLLSVMDCVVMHIHSFRGYQHYGTSYS